MLNKISNPDSEKTASDTTQAPAKTASEIAKEALETSLRQAVGHEKQASANSSDPVDLLIKEAQKLAEDAQTLEVVHARNCGHAFADAAAETWASHQQKFASSNTEKFAAEEQMLVKQAEEQGYMATMQKVAAEQGYIDTMTKVAAEQGYIDTMQKVAAEYQSGQSSALEDVRNTAAQEFLKGAQEVDVLISQMNAR
jgi:hypothetical protein